MYGPKYNHDFIQKTLGPMYDGCSMWKKGAGGGPFTRRNWKERFFVLDIHSEPQEPKISYYSARKAYHNGEKPKGSLYLDFHSQCHLQLDGGLERKNKALREKVGLIVSCHTSDHVQRDFNGFLCLFKKVLKK